MSTQKPTPKQIYVSSVYEITINTIEYRIQSRSWNDPTLFNTYGDDLVVLKKENGCYSPISEDETEWLFDNINWTRITL